MPFGNWSDLAKTPKVSVALNAERRDKAAPSTRSQTIKPLTCLWDFEGTVLLTSHSCIFCTGSMAAFSLSLLLETHPVKRQHEDQSKSGHQNDSSAWDGGRNSELVVSGGKNGPRHLRLWTEVRLLIWLGRLETLLPLTRGGFYSSPGRGVIKPPAWLFPSLYAGLAESWGSSSIAMVGNT